MKILPIDLLCPKCKEGIEVDLRNFEYYCLNERCEDYKKRIIYGGSEVI